MWVHIYAFVAVSLIGAQVQPGPWLNKFVLLILCRRFPRFRWNLVCSKSRCMLPCSAFSVHLYKINSIGLCSAFDPTVIQFGPLVRPPANYGFSLAFLKRY
ncbi:hypothetical protein DEU56DRAFT_766633 [Suillus clintonianus]|uniref:uncharacterized protein n=1 Tax=Suillus clintonianus TaxID=1904413 RepID=UPI001B87DEF9|nr:uncharacterized protein DEU56DRAFT_766633 [Suillus clintonianus]KAG2156345.1 hypothetical protein DEU56DRAFT_766633 [Suillus clintonianus]